MMLTHDILTKMSADESLKAKVEETKRILQDPIYFIETYIKITDAETGRQIPFLLYKYQRRAIKKYMKRKRCLTMKSRQTGLTTVTQAFMAWVMVTKDNQICKCISNRMKISVKFLQGVRQMLDGAKMATGKLIITGQGKRKYKSWIIPEYSVSLNAKEAFALENNSTIIAEGNTPEAGRGDTINWLVIDEVAAIDYQKKSAMEDIWASAGPALTRSGGTCIAISTPKGKRGWYFDQYVDAESKGWDIIEAPWVENPIYNLGMYRWVKSTAEGAGEDEGSLEVLNDSWPDTSHPDNLAKYKTKETYEYIKDGKIRSPWYDVESRSLGTNRTACELDCSFSGSGGECLESEVINNHKLLCMEPIRKGLLGFMKSYFTFKEYVKGREYLIIVDIATGDGSDSSTVIVIDIADLEVVATFKDDKITPDNLAFVVYDVAKEYGKPTVVIENNGPGLTCLLKLQNDLNYDNTKIYRSKLKKKDPNERDGKKSKLGFWQSNETRSLGGNTLEEWLNTYKIKINDKRIQKELETWVWKDGRRDHLPDKHDDLIMALTMCAYILRYVYGRYAKIKDKKESGALTVQRQRIGLQRTVVYNKFDNGLDEEGFST